jgi:hypothetical protein
MMRFPVVIASLDGVIELLVKSNACAHDPADGSP